MFLKIRYLSLGYANVAGEVVESESGARPSRALQQRFTGPHRLLQARGDNAFELDIPEHLRLSCTRNVAEFKRDQVDHSRPQAPPSPVHIAKKSGQAEYEVDRIVGWRERDGAAEFEVKWTEYGEDENTWEPSTNIMRFGGRDPCSATSSDRLTMSDCANYCGGRTATPAARGGGGGGERDEEWDFGLAPLWDLLGFRLIRVCIFFPFSACFCLLRLFCREGQTTGRRTLMEGGGYRSAFLVCVTTQHLPT